MDCWKYLNMKNDKITIEVNLLIKKSRKTRDYIKQQALHNELTKELISKIIQMIANDTYEFNQFQAFTDLFQLIATSQDAKNAWTNVNKLMIAYSEEFNQDVEIYKILYKIYEQL